MIKRFTSDNYNMAFNDKTGTMVRLGANADDDPKYCEFGPEILDIEISAGGDCMGMCPFCYKANGGDTPTHNMTFEQFRTILSKMNKDVLCQMALGIMDIKTNPDFFDMMRHARSEGVIPNYTTHGLDMTPRFAKWSADVCGCVSVSVVDFKATLSAVHTLKTNGMGQVNIHYMLSEETLDGAFKLIESAKNEVRLRDLHAIVFLQYKAKGRGLGRYTTLRDPKQYQDLMAAAEKAGVAVGMDSCSAPMYMKAIVENSKNAKDILPMVEPCESGLFSSYINCKGMFFPCSFMEGEGNWTEGLDVLNCGNFTTDIWMNPRVVEWRNGLITPPECDCSLREKCRICPMYKELRCL